MILDLDQVLLCRPGWMLRPEDQLPNRAQGKIDLDLAKIKLFHHPRQNVDMGINGRKLRAFLLDQPVLPDLILDTVLKNPSLLPRSWIGMSLPFWGSIYHCQHAEEFVGCKHSRPDEDLYIRTLIVTERGIHERAISLYVKHDRTFRVPVLA